MKHLKISLLMLLVFTLLCGVVYPLAVTGIGAAVFPWKSGGSLIVEKGSVKGSALIGQNFTRPEYFHGRPSAVNYDSALSGASNLGPTNKKLIDSVRGRAVALRGENGLDDKSPLPDDLLFASGSGLDPHISVESAKLQSARIAAARKIESAAVNSLIDKYTERQLPFYGRTYVNVMKLNMALDAAAAGR